MMLKVFNVYKHYPFNVPVRVRFFNLFRCFFLIPSLESFLISRLNRGRSWYSRLVPPLYFYRPGSMRIAERNGLKFRLDISRLLDHSIYFNRIKEPAWEVLFQYVEKNSFVIDVGANIGFLSLNFARIASEGLVFSFEPDSQNFEDLKNNIHLNGFSNIRASKRALGGKTERATLYKLYPNNPGANRILFSKPEQSHQVENVDIYTLDHSAEEANIPRVDLMKIDVEGFEIFVLQGAKNLIAKWKPILFVELAEINLHQHGYTALALVEFIQQLGYDVKDANTMEEIDKLKTDYHTDIICFPQKKEVT